MITLLHKNLHKGFFLVLLFASLNSSGQTLYWGGTAAESWTATSGTRWGTVEPTYNTTWTSGRQAVFNVPNSTITGATTGFAGIIANENVTVTGSGTLGTGGTVATIDVASGKTFDFGSQTISTATGTGFIKAGLGTLAITGSAYLAGFTLNAGTVVLRSINGMGDGGALTINGGTIACDGTRTLTNKYPSGITINGDFTLGSTTAPAVSGANLTFTNTMALGGGSRTITIGGTGTYFLNGVISNGSVVIASTAAGIISLGAANTYTGGTTITGGTLQLGASGVLADAGMITLNGGTLKTGASTGFSETVNTLALTDNSTIALGTGSHTLTFAASNGVSWTSGKTITVTGWTGTIANGSSGTAGQIFAGANSSGLTAAQLAQIKFSISGINYPAMILSTGEIVPALKFAITSISPASPCSGIGFSAVVQSQDFDGIARAVTNASNFSLSTNGNAGTLGGTTTGSIAAGTSSVTVSGITLSAGGTGVTLTAAQSSGDQLITAVSASFTAGTTPVITAQPADQTVFCGASTASFTAVTSTGGVTYQWQESTNNGSTWGNISNGGSYAGALTDVLSLSSLTSVFNAYQYRCVITSGSCSSTSSAAILTVNAVPVITASPSNSTIAANGSTSFAVAAAGNALTYQWQESTNNGAVWNNIVNGGVYSNAATSVLSLTSVPSSMNEYDYRCIVTNSCGSVTSTGAVLFLRNQGVYQSLANGDWAAYTTWQRYNSLTAAWANCALSDYPDYFNAVVTVLNGHTVDLDGTGIPPFDIKTLAVNTGGKLWVNHFNGSNNYLNMYGNITCDGTIGTAAGDDICFNIAGGANCTITGSGSFTAGRIRKHASLYSTTNASLTIDMNVYLTWTSSSGTVLYNDGSPSNFIVTVNSGKTVRGSGPGPIAANVAIDGNNFSGPDGNASGGSYTVYGTIDIDGILFATTNNASAARSCTYTIKTGGLIKCRYVRADASGAAGAGITIESGGKLNLFGSIDTVSSANDTTWARYSAVNNTFNFQAGSIVEYSGATRQQLNGIASYKNLIVSGGGIKKLGLDVTAAETLTLTSGVVQTNAYKMITTSTAASDLVHSTGAASFVYGNLRRYIASNTSTYSFPVGDGAAGANYKRADLVNNNLAGITYIDGFVNSVTETSPNDDATFAGAGRTQTGFLLSAVQGNAEWDLTPNAAASSGDYGVQLYVLNTGLSGADDNTFCPVKRPSSSTTYADWDNFEAGTTIPSSGLPGRIYNGGAGYAQRLGYTSFSRHAIATSTSTLPIELLSFNAKYNGSDAVNLSWTTASEINNDYFTIERSIDAADFKSIAVLDGAGNSSAILNYFTVDHSPLNGISYYRLKQTDFNGKTSYSQIVPIDISASFNAVIYPNPALDMIHVRLSSDTKVKGAFEIVTLQGVVLSQVLVQPSEEGVFSIELNSIAAGAYILRTTIDNETKQTLFIKQ